MAGAAPGLSRLTDQAIDFLTRTGHVTTDTRQEFVLLSDVLGVSSAVDVLTNSRTADTTPSALLGPFYVDGPPTAEQGADIARGLPGTPLWVDVTVTDTAGNPVPDTVIDVCQSNEDGYYDPGYQQLITQLFVRGGPYLDTATGQGDAVFAGFSAAVTRGSGGPPPPPAAARCTAEALPAR